MIGDVTFPCVALASEGCALINVEIGDYTH